MTAIAFLGNASATEDEKSALDYLGRILAFQEIDLVTVDRGDSNKAVLEGFRARDGVPQIFETGLLDADVDQFIVYANKELMDILTDQAAKSTDDWRDRPHILLHHKQQLFDFLDLVLGEIQKKTGITVEPF